MGGYAWILPGRGPRGSGEVITNPQIWPSEQPLRQPCDAEPVLEDDFDCELNFPRCCGGTGQRTSHGVQVSSTIEDVRVRGGGGRSKVDVIQNVEDLRTELHVESLRDPFDVIVFKQREVQRCDARADQNVAAGIAAQVVTQWEGHGSPDAWWHRIAILVPKCHIGSGGYGEALSLNVVRRISGGRKRLAAGPTQPVRKYPIVTAVSIFGV